MEFDDLTEELCRNFPELAAPIVECAGPGNDEGQYIIYENVFARYIEGFLRASESPARNRKLNEIFQFLESLFQDGGEVENLAYIAILEDRPDRWLYAAKPFLGPRAVSALDKYERGWRIRSQDPRVPWPDPMTDRFGLSSLVSKVLANGS